MTQTMKIDPLPLTIRELVSGYSDDGDGGVQGWDGVLDIRPPCQREFVCKDAQRAAVIHSVLQGYPLNAMHWAERPGKLFEIVDGQQRTISIGQYVTGKFSLKGRHFHSLQADEQDALLDCKLTIFVCSGTDSEKLAWDETLNIAGATLTRQELRNAAYTGPWLADARRHFSKPGGPAAGRGKDHLAGAPSVRSISRPPWPGSVPVTASASRPACLPTRTTRLPASSGAIFRRSSAGSSRSSPRCGPA